MACWLALGHRLVTERSMAWNPEWHHGASLPPDSQPEARCAVTGRGRQKREVARGEIQSAHSTCEVRSCTLALRTMVCLFSCCPLDPLYTLFEPSSPLGGWPFHQLGFSNVWLQLGRGPRRWEGGRLKSGCLVPWLLLCNTTDWQEPCSLPVAADTVPPGQPILGFTWGKARRYLFG